MFRVLFLLLIVMSSVAFAQTEEKPQVVKIDEFEKATNGYVKMKMDYFYTELNNNPNAQGYIINYGTDREIAIRERQIRDAIRFRRFDSARITVVNGGFRGVVKSEFWLVPAGAENPKIESSSRFYDEIGVVVEEIFEANMDSFFQNAYKNPDDEIYLVNYGTAKQILRRERMINRYFLSHEKTIKKYLGKFDLKKVKLLKVESVDGEKTKIYIDSSKNKETDKK